MFLMIVNSKLFLRLLYRKNTFAFSLLYRAYAPALYGWITNILADNNDVSREVLSNVFISAWEDIGLFKRRKQRLFIWLLSITRSQTLTAISDLDTWPCTTKLEDISGDPQRMLALMDEGPRCVFELMYYREYTKAETAQALNIPLDLADRLFKAAIDRLLTFMHTGL